MAIDARCLVCGTLIGVHKQARVYTCDCIASIHGKNCSNRPDTAADGDMSKLVIWICDGCYDRIEERAGRLGVVEAEHAVTP